MKRTIAATILAALALTGFIRAVRAQEKDEPVDPRILAYDKGPSKIDVSKYPPEMKAKYKVFADKCSKCHTIARPINCEFALDDEWERYIKRMMRRGGKLISPDEAEAIFTFATYDARMRKPKLYETKMNASR